MATIELTDNQKRALFVRVGFDGEPDTQRNIVRFRLKPAYINRIFGCDIECLEEAVSGVVVWPQHWVEQCLPAPTVYNIRERVWPELDPDALEQDEYRGGTCIVVDNVPPDANATALAAWLHAGLEADDPEVAEVVHRLEFAAEQLKDVREAIAALPIAKVPQGFSEAMAIDMKAVRAQELGEQRVDLEAAVARLQAALDAVRERRRVGATALFTLKLAERKRPLPACVWEVHFGRHDEAQKVAYIASHKFNWSEFRLALNMETGEIRAGRVLGDLEAPWNEYNMREATVTRRRHGRGLVRFSDERGYYSGAWRHGLRHGVGTEISVLGRFQGTFVKDWRRGAGTQIFSHGDVYRGNYDVPSHHPSPSLLFGDEYADGVMHGHGRMRFVDGSVYVGEFHNGMPTGKGSYNAPAVGMSAEGSFGPWGHPHGHASVSRGDVAQLGTWQDGAMVGEGTEIDALTGTYEGEFRHGERHGFGVHRASLVDGRYVGWWQHGLRAGRGVFDFGNVDRDDQLREERLTEMNRIARRRAHVLSGVPFSTVTGGAPLSSGHAPPTPAPLSSAPASPSRAGGGAAAAAAAAAAAGGGGQRRVTGPAPPPDSAGARRRREKAAAAVAAAVAAASAAAAAAGEDVGAAAAAAAGSEYERVRGNAGAGLRYRGDYRYEGHWRGGAPRSGGVFTERHGTPVTYKHSLHYTHDGANLHLPVLDRLLVAEADTAAQRAVSIAATARAVASARRAKEAENLASYEYWSAAAERAFAGVRMRTRRGRAQLAAIAKIVRRTEIENDEDVAARAAAEAANARVRAAEAGFLLDEEADDNAEVDEEEEEDAEGFE